VACGFDHVENFRRTPQNESRRFRGWGIASSSCLDKIVRIGAPYARPFVAVGRLCWVHHGSPPIQRRAIGNRRRNRNLKICVELRRHCVFAVLHRRPADVRVLHKRALQSTVNSAGGPSGVGGMLPDRCDVFLGTRVYVGVGFEWLLPSSGLGKLCHDPDSVVSVQ
jgi:hypothetical protein